MGSKKENDPSMRPWVLKLAMLDQVGLFLLAEICLPSIWITGRQAPTTRLTPYSRPAARRRFSQTLLLDQRGPEPLSSLSSPGTLSQ